MTQPWIKMRTNLWDDPRVGTLCDLLTESGGADVGEATVCGALFRLWGIADQHSEDGVLPMSAHRMDAKLGVPGFCEAMVTVGWLSARDGALRVTRFDEHNGSSAKKRSADAQRKGVQRSSVPRPANVRTDADTTRTERGQKADKSRTERGTRGREREDKSREGGGWRELVPNDLASAEFIDAFALFVGVCEAKGKVLEFAALQAMFKRLVDMGHDRALAAIRYTASNSWVNIKEDPDAIDRGNGANAATRGRTRGNAAYDREAANAAAFAAITYAADPAGS